MLAAATEPAASLPGEAVILAVIALVGTLGAAYVPVFLARRKPAEVTAPATSATPPAAAPAPSVPPPPVQAGPDAFDLLEQALRDLRVERDRAIDRADRMERQLAEQRAEHATQIADLARRLRDAELHIARVEAARTGWGERA